MDKEKFITFDEGKEYNRNTWIQRMYYKGKHIGYLETKDNGLLKPLEERYISILSSEEIKGYEDNFKKYISFESETEGMKEYHLVLNDNEYEMEKVVEFCELVYNCIT